MPISIIVDQPKIQTATTFTLHHAIANFYLLRNCFGALELP